jgi:hypothetical protein
MLAVEISDLDSDNTKEVQRCREGYQVKGKSFFTPYIKLLGFDWLKTSPFLWLSSYNQNSERREILVVHFRHANGFYLPPNCRVELPMPCQPRSDTTQSMPGLFEKNGQVRSQLSYCSGCLIQLARIQRPKARRCVET